MSVRPVKALRLFILSLVATLSSLIFGVYIRAGTFHEVRSGFPLPILTQKIKINPASLEKLDFEPFNFIIDLLFWLFLFYLISLRKKLKAS